MPNELMRQRIRWLVEHGGIAEDAMTDVKRELKMIRWGIGAIALIDAVAGIVLLL